MMTMPTHTPQAGLGHWMRRFVPRIAIVVVGAAVAFGSLEYTSFLRPTVIQHPVADVLSGRATKGDTAAPNASTGTPTLGADVQHDRISYWLNKLSTSMREGVETALGRKTKYSDMIESKLEERHIPPDLVYLA